MPVKLGIPELMIILMIVLVLFGSSRIAMLGKELGGAIRAFRQEFKVPDEDKV